MANIVGVSTEPLIRVENKYVFKVHFVCTNCSYVFEQSFLKGDNVFKSSYGNKAVITTPEEKPPIYIKCANCNSDAIDIRYREVVGNNK